MMAMVQVPTNTTRDAVLGLSTVAANHAWRRFIVPGLFTICPIQLPDVQFQALAAGQVERALEQLKRDGRRAFQH
jgi:hypothetical protein